MTPALSAELILMAACCRWPPSPARDAAVGAAALAPLDWALFERILARHRVAALTHDGLRRAGVAVPPAVTRRLADAAAAARRRSLVMAREALRLQHAFDEAGVPAVFVKGSSLAVLAYGDLGMKQAWDIDLLTTAEGALAGRKLLEGLGYAIAEPNEVDDDHFVRSLGLVRERVFVNSSLDIAVELHWRLVDNPWLLPQIGALSPTQEVEIGGARIRTLADETLFAFLCVHGTSHGWARFKWLADVGAFLGGRGEADIEDLHRASVRLGAGRSSAVALLLCHRLLGLAIAPSLLAEFRGDRVIGAIETLALRCMTYRGGVAALPYVSITNLRLLASHFFFVPGRRYFWSEIKIKWTSSSDRAQLPLPRSLDFVYHLLRLPLWLGRFGKRLLGRTAT